MKYYLTQLGYHTFFRSDGFYYHSLNSKPHLDCYSDRTNFPINKIINYYIDIYCR